MWRRASTRLPTLASWWHFNRSPALSARSSTSAASSQHPTHFHQNPAVLSHRSLSDSGRKRVEDVMPIATGHEREEIVAELEGRNILEMNYPVGPFGTKAEMSRLPPCSTRSSFLVASSYEEDNLSSTSELRIDVDCQLKERRLLLLNQFMTRE